MYLIDLHVHYKRHARDADGFEEDMVKAAVDRGLHGIMFTEHHQQLTNERIAELADKYAPLKIYNGIEVNVEGHDVLVIHPEGYFPWFHRRFPNFTAFMASCQQLGASTILAHPFRRGRGLPPGFMEWSTTAIEMRSRNTPLQAEPKIRDVVDAVDIPMLTNSDAHRSRHVGAYYNVFSPLPEDNRLLAESVPLMGWFH